MVPSLLLQVVFLILNPVWIFVLIQKTILGPEIWEFDKCDRTQYQNWKVEHIARDEDTFDTALILNVRHNICSDVERYLKEQGVHVGRIINFSPEDTGSTGFSIQNGTHSSKLAMEVYAALAGRSTVERRAYLHIFAPRLMRLCFILGKYPVHLESVFCTNMILNNEATALTYRPFSLTGKEDLNERNTNLFSGFLD